MKNKSTLKEIAQRAGVSVMTASNVINGKEGHYSEETYERVIQAASEVGYVPNLAAKHLRKGKLGLIALVLPDIMNPYLAELSQFVIKEADAKGYTVILSFTDNDPEVIRSILNGSLQLPVDGIMMAPHLLDVSAFDLDVPVVLFGEKQSTTLFDNIVLDNDTIAQLATRHLIELGRKKIAPIGLLNDDLGLGGMPQARARGYLQAMQDAGLPVDPEWLVVAGTPTYHRDHGAEVMKRLLALAEPLDAVFCFNDLIALGAMKVLIDSGRRIPDDVAVIGVDDIIDSRYFNPPLSTVSLNRKDIAALSVGLLLDRIDGKRNGPPEFFTPRFTLVPRTSTIGSSYCMADELF